jgi:hypothetical protein
MWNNIVYERGGLALHAGCKAIPVDGEHKTMLIVGLSGTGKTTTTFTKQLGSQPVQDDFVALMPGGRVYTTENGCFAKTFGLDPKYERDEWRDGQRELLERESQRLGFYFLNTYPYYMKYLKEHPDANLATVFAVSERDGHPNSVAHSIDAQALLDYLSAHRLLPSD